MTCHNVTGITIKTPKIGDGFLFSNYIICA